MEKSNSLLQSVEDYEIQLTTLGLHEANDYLKLLVKGLNEEKRTNKYTDNEYVKCVGVFIQKFKNAGYKDKYIYQVINRITNNWEPVYHQFTSLEALIASGSDVVGGNMKSDTARMDLDEKYNDILLSLSKTQTEYFELFRQNLSCEDVAILLKKSVKTVNQMHRTLEKLFDPIKDLLIEESNETGKEVTLPDDRC